MTICKDCYFYEECLKAVNINELDEITNARIYLRNSEREETTDYIVRKNHYCSSFIAAEKKKEGKE